MYLTRCVAKFLKNIIAFLKSHFGYLANSVDPDQPVQKLADQDLYCYALFGN